MSNGDFQACLARLFVDRTFRELFTLEPEVALLGYKLSHNERGTLKAIDRKEVVFFASMVAKRRLTSLRSFYPHTAILLERDFERLFNRYHQLHLTVTSRQEWQDPDCFGEFLLDSTADLIAGSEFIADVLRFEQLSCRRRPTYEVPSLPHLKLSPLTEQGQPNLKPGVEIAEFAYDVVVITTSLAETSHLKVPPSQGTYYFVFHSAPNQRPTASRIGAATHFLLNSSDGSRSIAEIVLMTQERFNRSDLEQDVYSTLSTLRHLGLIELTVSSPLPSEDEAERRKLR